MLRQQKCKYCCSSSRSCNLRCRRNENKIHKIYVRILDIFPCVCVYLCV